MFDCKTVCVLLFLLLPIGKRPDKTSAVVGIDPEKAIIWGPGLKPAEIVMQARYFFLQLVDQHGNNLTESPGEGKVSVHTEGLTSDGHACRIWSQIFDCMDGSFIIRYRIYTTCHNFKLNVSLAAFQEPVLVLDSRGPVYEDECYCPNRSVNKWLDQLECPKNYSRMIKDLASFPKVNFNNIREHVIRYYNHPDHYSFCHYVVKSNEVFRKCYGRHVGFKIFMDNILLSLTRKVVLPDIEFFVNLGDWPLVRKEGMRFPIFSWCGAVSTRDIIMPSYDITESSLQAMGGVMLDMLTVQGNTDTVWERKIDKVFWRGRDANRPRLDLIDISRKHPELFNASITNFFFFTNEIEKYGPAQKRVSFFDFFKYKYQLNIDGTVAAYRFPYLLAGDGLVFKQDSIYYEFFYGDLVPGVHYVPVNDDLSDLVEQVIWAKEHDEQAKKIAKAARQFARDNLLPRDIFCYYAVLFNEWSKRLIYKVEVLDDMRIVLQPKHSCYCYNSD